MSAERTLLFLVRHGATPANEREPFILQGSGIDQPLSANGECQATAVAALLSKFPLTAVYSSTMLRARQTAAAIAAPHALPLKSIDALRECNVGAWEGMDWESVRKEFPEAHSEFVENPAVHANLGGESYRDVLSRALPVLEDLLQRHAGETIAVVAHNVVNRACLSALLGMELRKAPSIRQANGGVNLIQHAAGQTTVVTLNSTFHLDGQQRS